MEYNELTQLISTIGFPIAVATYMMIKNEKSLKENNDLLQKLTFLIESLIDKKGDDK